MNNYAKNLTMHSSLILQMLKTSLQSYWQKKKILYMSE
jgi:hypothetical protein